MSRRRTYYPTNQLENKNQLNNYFKIFQIACARRNFKRIKNQILLFSYYLFNRYFKIVCIVFVLNKIKLISGLIFMVRTV